MYDKNYLESAFIEVTNLSKQISLWAVSVGIQQ